METRILERLVDAAFPRLANAARAALVAEKRAAVPGDGPGRSWVIERGDAVAVAFGEAGRDRAWLFGLAGERGSDEALDALCEALAGAGMRALATGGPPGGYLVSGVGTGAAPWFVARGFVERSRHVELTAKLARPAGHDPRIRRAGADEAADLCQWIGRTFTSAWQREATRAFDLATGLFTVDADVATSAPMHAADGGWAGFAAHSGNNVARGTFGPIGVSPVARRSGLGSALARAALDDLSRRGHEYAVIPWVAHERVAFYRALVDRMTVHERVVLVRALDRTPRET